MVKCIAQSVSTASLLILSFFLFSAKLRVISAMGCTIIFVATYLYLRNGPQPKLIVADAALEMKKNDDEALLGKEEA